MKLPLTCLAVLAAASLAAAADPAPAPAAGLAGKPELRGVMDLGDAKRFLLASPGGAQNKWEGIGDSYGEWKVTEYRDKDRTLVLRRDDGTELDLGLLASAATGEDVKATVEDAEVVLRKMNFEKMITSALAAQKQAMLAMSQKIAGGTNAKGFDPAAFAAYQKQVMDLVQSAMDPKQMESDVATIYSNVFTKDQLAGLGDFYDSPAGQAFTEKQPEIQQQMQQVVMPRIMAVMPQLQTLAKTFQQQSRAAAAAANAASPAPAAQP
jgi:uncharacterized protein